MPMRLTGVAAWFLLLVGLRVTAQQPLVPGPTPSPQPLFPAATAPEPEPYANSAGILGVQILLGQQTGIRGQVTLARTDCCTFVAEGFYGMLATKFDSSEGAGTGVRALFRRTSHDGNNTILLGPGVNVFFPFDENSPSFIAPSLDISWLHGFGGGGGWEIGISAGLGIALEDEVGRGETRAGELTPIISLFSGFRF